MICKTAAIMPSCEPSCEHGYQLHEAGMLGAARTNLADLQLAALLYIGVGAVGRGEKVGERLQVHLSLQGVRVGRGEDERGEDTQSF